MRRQRRRANVIRTPDNSARGTRYTARPILYSGRLSIFTDPEPKRHQQPSGKIAAFPANYTRAMRIVFRPRTVLASAVLLFSQNWLTAQSPKPAFGEPAPQISWSLQDSGTTASLRGIVSVDGKIAWASGSGGTVIKTLDGGAHWTPCAVPPDAEKLDFRGIQAADASHAIVMSSGPGDQSRLYKTDDGCKSWKMLFKNPDSPEGFFDSFFADWTAGGHNAEGKPAWTGSLLGDPVHGTFVVFDTPDSGVTWVARKSPDLALNGVDLSGFAASNSLFPANQDGAHTPHIFASGGKGGAVVWIETDAETSVGMASPSTMTLSHWSRVAVPLAGGNEASGIFSIGRRTESVPFRNVITIQETLMAVGGDYQKPNESNGTAAWSVDHGLHWTAAAKPPHGYRSAVAWSAEFNVWIAAGTNGSDFSSEDGKTWTALDGGNWNALSLPFAVGPKGRIGRLSSAPGR
jgi:photosystem II stability/assembly factor-like uncharacterized protein